MGDLLNEINGLINSMKGLDVTRQNTLTWYKKTLNSTADKSIVRTSGVFQPGKIYIFRYETPITEDIKMWDLNPVVLSLGRDDGKDIGINLNLIPYSTKVKLLDKIYTMYKSKIDDKIRIGGGNALSEGYIAELNYIALRHFIETSGMSGAIRTYYTNLRKNTAVISFSDWKRIALLDIVQIKGGTINKVYSQFRKAGKKKE